MPQRLLSRRALIKCAAPLIASPLVSKRVRAQIDQSSAAQQVSCPYGSVYPDGCANASAGRPQHQHLLDLSISTNEMGVALATRPPWNVAGVDYAVGANAGTILKIPSPANLPQGSSLYRGAIYVNGNNITLNGYDLSHLTVMIYPQATGTVTVRNCTTTTTGIIRSTTDARVNLIVEYCTLDGGDRASDSNFATIQTWCPTTVRNCYIGNSGQGIHVTGRNFTCTNNFLEGFAWAVGQHANAIYVSGSDNPAVVTTIQNNTVYSKASSTGPPNGPIGIGAAIALFGDGGSFSHWDISNNVIIAAFAGCASYLIGPYVSPPLFATGGVVNQNYMWSVNGWSSRGGGAFGPFYSGSPGLVQATFSGNIDMANGKTLDGGKSLR